jgi:hypothetical protein
VLFLAAVLCIFIIIAVNFSWYRNLWGYWNDFKRQRSHPDPEYRKTELLGNRYTVSKAITTALCGEREKGRVIVLLPPTGYFRQKGLHYHVPEPTVFYYYTGLKTVWHNAKDTASITHAVEMKDGEIIIYRIKSREQLSAILAEFRKYQITL